MKYFIYLQYDGTVYHGWQTQPNATSVQQTIEEKLSMLLRRELFIVGAGRTDAGVHASMMVAHFVYDMEGETDDHTDCKYLLDCEELTRRLNQVLPEDILIERIVPVKPDAHARFSPISRMYRYYVTTQKELWHRKYSYRIYQDLDIDLMNEAAAKLFDYIDFTSFAKVHTDVKTNNCKIMHAQWTKRGASEYVFEIRADRFLRNMVRAIVGTLLQVGRHRMTVAQFCETIEKKNRCSAGDSVPGCALFLEDIEYPDNIFLEME